MKRILLCEYINGQTKPTPDGVALLIGITVEEFLDRCNPTNPIESLPEEWKRRLRKRGIHARNATGTDIANVNIAYLAVRDLGARIDFDEAAGQMWAVIDEESGG